MWVLGMVVYFRCREAAYYGLWLQNWSRGNRHVASEIGNTADHLLSIETYRNAANHYSSTIATSKQEAGQIYRDDWSRSMIRESIVDMVK